MGTNMGSYKRVNKYSCPINGFYQRFVASCLLISSFASTCLAESSQECLLGLKTPGRTSPRGNIVLEDGDSLEIFCILNDDALLSPTYASKNASDLSFFRYDKEVDPKYITIVNRTTIKLFIEKPPPAINTYYCKLSTTEEPVKLYDVVCLNEVSIGLKPREPKNFSCVSHNWENLTCTWEPMEHFVPTNYLLYYKSPGRRFASPCPKTTAINGNHCFWSSKTNPHYRAVVEYYVFVLAVQNVFGKSSFTYKFNHFTRVIPAEPTDLAVVKKNSHSAFLHWKIPHSMKAFPPGLHHRIAYRSQWDEPGSWKIISITSDPNAVDRYFNLTGLPYPNSIYTVRVSSRSSKAVNDDGWGPFSEISFETDDRVPDRTVPKTDMGSLQIIKSDDKTDIYIHFQIASSKLGDSDRNLEEVVRVEENESQISYTNYKAFNFTKFRVEVDGNDVNGNSILFH